MIQKLRPSIPKILLSGLLISSGSIATAAEDTATMDTMVITSTRSANSVLDQAGNIDTISTEEIDLLQPDHPSEILNRATGVYVHRQSGLESLPSVRSPVLTGPGAAGAFLFLEDGVALRAAGFANNNGLAEANMEQAGDIEIIRGPGSAFYGSNAVHGMINVLTRDPSDELTRNADLTAGPHGSIKLKGSISDTLGAHSYRINAYGAKDEGYRDETGHGVQKLTARHDYFGATTSVKTIFSFFNLNQETAGFITASDNNDGADPCFVSNEADRTLYKDDNAMQKNCNENGFRDWQSYRLSSRIDHDISEGKMFSITPYFRNNEMEFRQHYLPSQAIEENEHTSFGFLSGYYWDLDAGHKIVAGIDFEYTNGSLKETQERASYFMFSKARQQGVHYDYEVDATVIAPYVHTEWQLADALKATAGLRYEHTNYDYDNKVADGTLQADGSSCNAFSPKECLYQRPVDGEDSFGNLSPKFGLSYNINSQSSLFANLSRGFRAPQVTDIYRIQNNQVPREIEPERIDSLELGIRRVSQELSFEAVAYHMRKKNFFFRDSFGNNVTNAKTKHTGIELSTLWQMNDMFDLGVNYTYAIHKYKSDHAAKASVATDEINSGDDIDSAPRHIGNVRLGMNFMSDGRAELEWMHVSDYFVDPSNAHTYDGHDVINLRMSKNICKNVKLHARIDNLTNTDYATRADYAFGSYRFFGGEKISFYGGVTVDF